MLSLNYQWIEKDPAISDGVFIFVANWIEHSTDYLKISISFIHSDNKTQISVWKNGQFSVVRTAVAQRIEHSTDYRDGRGFDSRQWYAH